MTGLRCSVCWNSMVEKVLFLKPDTTARYLECSSCGNRVV